MLMRSWRRTLGPRLHRSREVFFSLSRRSRLVNSHIGYSLLGRSSKCYLKSLIYVLNKMLVTFVLLHSRLSLSQQREASLSINQPLTFGVQELTNKKIYNLICTGYFAFRHRKIILLSTIKVVLSVVILLCILSQYLYTYLKTKILPYNYSKLEQSLIKYNFEFSFDYLCLRNYI